jgi:hypothetical protein
VIIASAPIAAALASVLGATHLAVVLVGAVGAAALLLLANSAGLRRVLALAVLVPTLALSGCALTPDRRAELDECAPSLGQVAAGVVEVIPIVAAALEDEREWAALVGAAVERYGSAALCALRVLLASLGDDAAAPAGVVASGPSGVIGFKVDTPAGQPVRPGAATVPKVSARARARAQAYLDLAGFRP